MSPWSIPAGMKTVAGTVSESIVAGQCHSSIRPPEILWVIVTVQHQSHSDRGWSGLHITPETSAAAKRLTLKVWELLPSVAVRVAV